MSRPTLIFGAASIGMSFTTAESVTEILDLLKRLGISQIDTAGRYPPMNPGMSEKLLGEAGASKRDFKLDTKILTGPGDGTGDHEASAIAKSLSTSLQRLDVQEVNILHLHRPDPRTPLRDQAAALNEHYRNGSFKKLGVSNFQPELLSDFLAICEREGFVKPTVYQGDYNVVTRGMEKKLLPILRAHNMVYNAFRPLAAGFLTGHYTRGEHEGTRFGNDNALGKHFQNLYGSPELQQAMRKYEKAVADAGIPPSEAALRWLCYHSALQEVDGIILGASNLTHIEQNVASISKGPLPDELVMVIDEVWSDLVEQRGGIL